MCRLAQAAEKRRRFFGWLEKAGFAHEKLKKSSVQIFGDGFFFVFFLSKVLHGASCTLIKFLIFCLKPFLFESSPGRWEVGRRSTPKSSAPVGDVPWSPGGDGRFGRWAGGSCLGGGVWVGLLVRLCVCGFMFFVFSRIRAWRCLDMFGWFW